jgi:hypothetical protein
MQSAIEGQTAQREKSHAIGRASGIEIGKQWAMKEAEWEQLEAATLMDGETTFDDLFDALEDLSWDREVVEQLFGEARPSDAETQGFIEGARLVKELIEAA